MALHSIPSRHNLPVEPNRFIGRERDLGDLLRLLQESRVVTLSGVGGIGKTRLALRVAAQAAGSFPDGVWLAELSDAADQEHIVVRIAAAVGVAEEANRSLSVTLTDALRTRTLLLILDNSERVIEHVAAVATRLLAVCPHVSLLVTSREPARISGEAVWRVPPLELPAEPDRLPVRPRATRPDEYASSEAVQLFVERARAVAPGFAATPDRFPVITRICRVLDGIPLAIELAAARVRVLSLAQIADRLGDRFRFLSSGNRNVPARQQTLGAVIDWSHDLLSPAEQALLRRLSIFSGWDLDSAERVCADTDPEATVEPDAVLDLLSSLVDRSLVFLAGEHRGRARYRLLDTIRHYAAERLRASGEETRFRDRHRAYMLDLAERLAHNTVLGYGTPWSERFEIWYVILAEYDNLRAALRWSHERGDTDLGLRFCVALRPFWMATGQFAEGAYWTDLFLAAEPADEALRGQAMVRRAELAFDCKDHRAAAELGEEGLRRCRAAGDHASVALALNILAMIDMRARDHDGAAARLDEVLDLTRTVGDPWNEGIALGTRGALAAHAGDLAESRRYYDEALRILRDIDHQWGVGRTLIGQGMIAEAEGDLAAADRCYREAVDIHRSIGAPPELARCLAGVGRIAARRDDFAQAYAHLAESLALSHSTGQRMGVARGLAALAEVAAQQGVLATSHRLAGAAAAIREQVGLPESQRPLPGRAAPRGRRTDLERRWEEGRRLSIDVAVGEALALAERETGTGEAAEAAADGAGTAEPGAGGAGPATGAVTPVGASARAAAAHGPGATAGVGATGVGATGAREVPGPPLSALTAREREIATLIGAGMSNRRIAEELFISPATVARHVANIHTKLDFHSRTQIAAWITRHTSG